MTAYRETTEGAPLDNHRPRQPLEVRELTLDERDLIAGLLSSFILNISNQMRRKDVTDLGREEYRTSIKLAEDARFKMFGRLS